ncbi:hypothetical protein HAX54_040737, partial [Datura stramonium]|nr:hypothetical protein [Datura stramonium]
MPVHKRKSPPYRMREAKAAASLARVECPPANCQSGLQNAGLNANLGARLQATAQNLCFTCTSQ